ncbi:ABC transporter permease [Frankia sp. R43]|uniref:ABC transporter permease n=1 Tax=Frankia sp. R43 TaxID=269536 RepID=UPI0006CA3C12|nr:ABC transporter permease [Frankia sp. R43]KPM50721.1 ABC transporter permease [Frankia sp. R43]
MSDILQFAVLGFSTGAVYAVLGSSLVSIYVATGIINFAQGSLALWGVWQTAALQANGTLVLPVGSFKLTDGPTDTVPALLIGAASCLVWAVLAHFLVFRPLRRAPVLGQVVASVGMMLLLQALVTLRFDADTLGLDPTVLIPMPILPSDTFTLAGATIAVSNLILAGIAIAIAAGMWAYLRFTRMGTATRAGAEDERALRLLGYSPDRLAALVWGATGFVSGLIVVLAAPAIGGLDPTSYMFYVVPALSVALVGRLTSVGIVCAAGLGLGALQQILLFGTTKDWWPSWAQAGVGDAIPFVIVVVALFALGRGIPERGSAGVGRLPRVSVPRLRPLPVAGAVAVAGLVITLTSGTWRFSLVMSAIFALIAVSVVLLTGYLGQISLATMAFAGAAGFALSKLTTNAGVPFPFSLFLAAVVSTLLGIVVGVPALRIRGAQLAVATVAAALAIEAFVFNNPSLTPYSGALIKDPSLFGYSLAVREGTNIITLRFSYLVLAVVVLLLIAVARLFGGATGRAFLAVRSNERAASSAGVDVAATKLLGFAIASFLAGIGGGLIGYSSGQLSAASFTVLVGLTVLAMTYVGGITTITGAVIAGLAGPLGVLYLFLNQSLDLSKYYTLIAALGMLLRAVVFPPDGGPLQEWLAARLPRRTPALATGAGSVTAGSVSAGSVSAAPAASSAETAATSAATVTSSTDSTSSTSDTVTAGDAAPSIAARSADAR